VCQERREIAFSGPDGVICLWDPRAERLVSSIDSGSRRILSLRYCAEGQSLVWIGVEGRACRQQHASENKRELLFDKGREIRAACIDAAGQWIAMTDYLGNLELVERDNKSSRLERHRGAINSLAFDSGRKALAFGGRECAVRVWNLDGGQQAAALRGHHAPILSLAFSPDRRMIASGDAEGSILLWDRVNGTLLTKFNMSPTSSVDALVFANQGSLLAAGGTSSIMQLWSLPEYQGVRNA
jgi:WD40 repeat protein